MATVQNLGEFSVQTYGTGKPTNVVLGGLAYAPSDFEELAPQLNGTTHVLDNPIHTGKVSRTKDWQEWLRAEYAKLFEALDGDVLIGHSCGGYDGIDVASRTNRTKGMALLTPPTSFSGGMDAGRMQEFGLLDKCLATLCTDISDERYKRMLEEHFREYGNDARRLKDIYRFEPPTKTGITPDLVREQMKRLRLPLLIVTAARDPWNGKDLSAMRDQELLHVRGTKIDANHYAHISQPNDVAAMVNGWSSDAVSSQY
jgi:pimeloyl-ACP methyl ester carboxylesterase